MISIVNVTKRFRDTLALDYVSLEVQTGEIFFLLGPSGCGKTTLLRTIAGFVMPDEGRVLFGNEDLTHVPPHRRNTAMMFQSYALWPHMTVAKNVAFGLEERRVPRRELEQRVGDALRAVKMETLANRRIHELSGGQQQRVALARALVVHPRCLLLDEPLSNLDAKLRHEMRLEIRRICKEFGLTAVYVSHDHKEALSIGDRIAVMSAGRICQAGTPREVYARPKTQFVAEFLGETNLLRGTIVERSGETATVATPEGKFCGTLADPSQSAHTGEAVLLSIRPESWRLLAEKQEGTNAVRGRIVETIYLGEMSRHRFFAAGGTTLTMYQLNPRFGSGTTGDVYAAVDLADVVILPEK